MSRFSNDIDAISEGLLQAITQLFSSVMTIVGTMVLMILLNFWIALAVVVVAPMAILIAGYIARRSNALFQQQQAIIGEYNGCIEEAIGNLKLVKAYAYEKNIEAAAREINQRLYNCGQKAQFYSSLINPSTRFVNNMAYVSVGLIGGLSAAVGGLSIGAISSLLAYSAQFAKPLNEVAGITTQLQSALAAAKRFFALLDETSEPAENDKLLLKSLDSQNAIGQIEFSKVYFSYDERVPLIENFSIKIPQGSLVAVVGPTGAGKTTLVNLLMRFYDLDSGIISIDKQNTQEVTRDSVRLSFGMVLQETWLFSGSVRDNIAYGRPDATEQEIIDAAKASRAHGFIKRMEKGYDTVITEDGENLSQGEKQLLTIARAMLANPPMLILDEATSSVDPRTELKIQHALQNLMKGKTSFMIAHRLSTIQNADIILVMNQGKIVETGTHRQLINAGGLYSKLYHSQFSKT
ncbi:atp-binding cassette sub-family b [Holotrichia oblita]|nr:atp-binding cassette sub-family b [Holotrichia oblita]